MGGLAAVFARVVYHVQRARVHQQEAQFARRRRQRGLDPIGARTVVFDDGEHEAAVYDRALLLYGQCFAGPAVIEEPASVTVVRPGMPVRVDEYGHLLLGEIASS